MGHYTMGHDANGNPLEENRFYINPTTREIIQLFRDAAGFRVEYGAGGRHPNIFNLKEGPNYRPMTQEDFEKAIFNSTKRKSWLEAGLSALVQSPDSAGLKTNFNQRTAAMDREIEYLAPEDTPKFP